MAKIQTGRNSSKREVILQQAATLFKNKGFNAAPMRVLAEVLGVEAPSLYNHIGSKSELLQEICFRTGRLFTREAEIIAAQPLPPLERIEAIIRFHIRTMAGQFDEVYVANHEWKHLKEPALTEFLQIRRQYEKILLQLISAGTESGDIRPIHPYVAMLTLLSAVRGIEFWHRSKKNIPLQQLEDDMVNHLLNGLKNA